MLVLIVSSSGNNPENMTTDTNSNFLKKQNHFLKASELPVAVSPANTTGDHRSLDKAPQVRHGFGFALESGDLQSVQQCSAFLQCIHSKGRERREVRFCICWFILPVSTRAKMRLG